jgi:hypothetical protein
MMMLRLYLTCKDTVVDDDQGKDDWQEPEVDLTFLLVIYMIRSVFLYKGIKVVITKTDIDTH